MLKSTNSKVKVRTFVPSSHAHSR